MFQDLLKTVEYFYYDIYKILEHINNFYNHACSFLASHISSILSTPWIVYFVPVGSWESRDERAIVRRT